MPELRLVLAILHHQPLGQLDSVCEEAYRAQLSPVSGSPGTAR